MHAAGSASSSAQSLGTQRVSSTSTKPAGHPGSVSGASQTFGHGGPQGPPHGVPSHNVPVVHPSGERQDQVPSSSHVADKDAP